MKRILVLLCMLFVFSATGAANAVATYQLGPDVIADNPASPYTFTNAADGYGYKLEISPHVNSTLQWHYPVFTLTNTSANTWANIMSFKFTIGDTDYNFDLLYGVTGPLGEFTPDLNNDGSYGYSHPDNINEYVRSDFLEYAQFTGFDPQDVFTFVADVDLDGAPGVGTVEDFRTVFWNNAEALNSAITVTYSAPVIPTPSAVLLGGIGVGMVGWLRRRRTV